MIKRIYGEYVAVVSAFGVTPISEHVWEERQSVLPAAKGIVMPSSLNRAIAVAMEAGDLAGAAELISQCEEHDQDCWNLYISLDDHFPAGGLWFSHREWLSGARPEACPMNVAHMLDFDGDLPGDNDAQNLTSDNLTFDAVSDAYTALLVAQPGKTLRLSNDSAVFLENGQINGVVVDPAGQLEMETAGCISPVAWDDERRCWESDDNAEACFSPIFITLPV